MISIRVDHHGASYDVIVGDVDAAMAQIAKLAGGGRIPLISDVRVHALHGDQFGPVALAEPILIPEGEAAKDWATLALITDRLAELGVSRGTPIIALGGGSVGDVAALAASLFKRGCPIVQVPTTLLAQADSAIGGKTAIDAAGQKNLVGNFHHPSLVVVDPTFLDTLDARQLRSGYAEVVKYGLIDDPQFFGWCESNAVPLIQGDRAVRVHAIEHCLRAKTKFISADPGDLLGTRALLNFGHTFGHAIEAGGSGVLHGEAVAVGMVLAFRLSAEVGLCPESDGERVSRHLASVGLPTSLGDLGFPKSSDVLLDLMTRDKKADGHRPSLILTRGIGEALLVRDIDRGVVADFLRDAA